jgi:hypothetical protein
LYDFSLEDSWCREARREDGSDFVGCRRAGSKAGPAWSGLIWHNVVSKSVLDGPVELLDAARHALASERILLLLVSTAASASRLEMHR